MVRRRKNKEDKRGRNTLIFTGIAALVMILSGLYYIAPSGRTTPDREDSVSPPWNTYQISQLGNSSVLVKIKKPTSDLIALPGLRTTTPEKIDSLINSSIPGVNYISCDYTNFYFLCTFNLERENASEGVKEKLRNKFRDNYHLMRGFIGSLPVNISGTDEVYLIGKMEHEPGDYLRVLLFQREIGGLIAFEEKEIFSGENVPVKVLNITGYSFSGTVVNNFNLEPFSKKVGLNSSQVNYLSPGFVINETLNNETILELKSLEGVEVNINHQENKSLISFNHSWEDIKKLLKEKNLPYSFQNGSIGFNSGINSYVKGIKEMMEDFGVLGISVKKIGVVSFPNEVVFNERIAFIGVGDNFPVSLELDTQEGGQINISISVIQLGEQVIPFGASEVE